MRENLEPLLSVVDKLHDRHERADSTTVFDFEPGEMEYLEQSDGFFDEENGEFIIHFEAKGTRYDGRTFVIERIEKDDPVTIVREKENPFNSNNFTILNQYGENVGNMPAEMCNALAPLYDEGQIEIIDSRVSFVEHITERSRYAKQAILFIELKMVLK